MKKAKPSAPAKHACLLDYSDLGHTLRCIVPGCRTRPLFVGATDRRALLAGLAAEGKLFADGRAMDDVRQDRRRRAQE